MCFVFGIFRSFPCMRLCVCVCERVCSRLQFPIITHFVWDAIYRKEQKNFETMTVNDEGKIWKMPMDESVDLKNAFVLLGPWQHHTHNHNVRDNETDVQKETWTNILNTIFYLPGFCFRHFERTRFLMLLVVRSETHCKSHSLFAYVCMCVCCTLNPRDMWCYLSRFGRLCHFPFWFVSLTRIHSLISFIAQDAFAPFVFVKCSIRHQALASLRIVAANA